MDYWVARACCPEEDPSRDDRTPDEPRAHRSEEARKDRLLRRIRRLLGPYDKAGPGS